MHCLFFGLKRAYWGSVAKARKPLSESWPHLTPARFDLMYAVRQRDGQVTLQSHLVRVLGVCRPVVTRMLKSLMKLGWVTRRRSSIDRRTYDIELTLEGRELFDSAYHRMVRSMRVTRWVNQALLGPDWPDKDLAFSAMCRIGSALYLLRYAWNAGGTLDYPWCRYDD